MVIIFPEADLEYLVIQRVQRVDEALAKALANPDNPETFKWEEGIEPYGEKDWRTYDYTVSKKCPVNAHLCEFEGDEFEGPDAQKCAFYNRFKKEGCVYPRTCLYHAALSVDVAFTNIPRYFDRKLVAVSKLDDNQIVDKLVELGKLAGPKSKARGWGPHACEDWLYAEFEDDGHAVRLVELAESTQNVDLGNWAVKTVHRF